MLSFELFSPSVPTNCVLDKPIFILHYCLSKFKIPTLWPFIANRDASGSNQGPTSCIGHSSKSNKMESKTKLNGGTCTPQLNISAVPTFQHRKHL
jgi:hypothetical protein